MRNDQLNDSLTRLVSPGAVRIHAEGLGWERIEGVNGKIAVYKDPNSPLRQLIVPLDVQLDDYGQRTEEAIRRLAEFENRSPNEVLNQLLLPPSDLLFFREISSDAEAGNLPLDHAVRMIEGTKNMLLSGAHSVLKPQQYHPRMTRSEAEEFVSGCRLGQTERGSFILTIACPLEPNAALLAPGREPFSRRVTSLLMQSLEELVQAVNRREIDDLSDTARYPGISANLCESLLLLRPEGEQSSLNVKVSWSRTLLPENRETKREVKLGREVFKLAEVLAPKLRSRPQPRIDRFFGWVDELRGLPSRDDPRPSGEVRFTLIDQGEELRAKSDLVAEDYAIAGKAHFETEVVSFKGVLERLPRMNQVKEVAEFKIVDFDDGIPPDTEATSRA